MKSIYIIILSFLKLEAQTTDIVTSLDDPRWLQLDGNDLSIAEFLEAKFLK